MRVKNKKSFTLLELLICFFLIAMAGSFLSVKGYHLFHKVSCEGKVKKILSAFKECRELALLYGEDRVLQMKQDSKGLFFFTGFEGGQRKLMAFEGIGFRFNGKDTEDLEFQFYSTGLFSPVGKLDLFDFKKNMRLEIDLARLFQIENH